MSRLRSAACTARSTSSRHSGGDTLQSLPLPLADSCIFFCYLCAVKSGDLFFIGLTFYVFGLSQILSRGLAKGRFFQNKVQRGGGLHLPPRIWLDRYFKRNSNLPNPPRNAKSHGWTSSAPLLLALTAGGADSFYLLPFQVLGVPYFGFAAISRFLGRGKISICRRIVMSKAIVGLYHIGG